MYEGGIKGDGSAGGADDIDFGDVRPGGGTCRTSAPFTMYIPLSTEQVNRGVTDKSSANRALTAGERATR